MQFSEKPNKQAGRGLPHLKMKRTLPLEPKGQNFSTHEKLLLLELISIHGRQLVDENETLSIFRRSRIWRVVYNEFNQHQGIGQRTEKQLRLLWKNLKARCKREFRLNASKYRTPGYVISDPLLRKMSTLIGTEGDIPTRYGRYADVSVTRKVTKTVPLGIAKKASRPQQQQRPVRDLSLDPGPSQIQIAKTYSMASPTLQQQDISQIAPVLIGIPNHEVLTATMTTGSLPSQAKLGRVNMAVPVRGREHLAAGTSNSNQLHTSLGAETTQEQSRNGETSGSPRVRKMEELSSYSRRKKAIPRKASEAVKAEVVEIEDDIINLEVSEEICEEYFEETRDNAANKQSNGDGWLEDAGGPSSDLTGTHLQVAEDSTGPGPETSRDSITTRGAITQNNLHHHMPIRVPRKPTRPQHIEHEVRHLPDDYLQVEGTCAEDVEGGLDETLLHDQGHEVDVGVTEAKDCSVLEKNMMMMARKEHDMKMTTMVMKRKQIMQIKRREHLVKMENFRLNKEILRLKKRKLELEIRNSLYLEEVEDELDS